jgi:Fur family transcriptional regulator, peroxide stress response regulator
MRKSLGVINSMKDVKQQLNRLLTQLESGGRRITPQRMIVCEALLAHGSHPTATQLWQRVHTAHPSISQATVYNTIAVLEELRLVQKLEIAGDEHAHYDINIEPHVNAFCTRCGRITDVFTDTLEALLVLVAHRSSYHLAPGSGVIVYGICAECQDRTATLK